MNSLLLLLFIILFIILFTCQFYKIITIKKIVHVSKVKTKMKTDIDLLNQNQFYLDKMNPNKWNYGNPDFAPYIDGSYKQVTNNYVPGFKFNN